jgi:hypothetical protein
LPNTVNSYCFIYQVLQAQQKQEDAHAKQKVDGQELFSATAFQMTDTREKASDIPVDDTPKAGIHSKEKVDAHTNIPTTGAKVKFNKNHFSKIYKE